MNPERCLNSDKNYSLCLKEWNKCKVRCVTKIAEKMGGMELHCRKVVTLQGCDIILLEGRLCVEGKL